MGIIIQWGDKSDLLDQRPSTEAKALKPKSPAI